ncbi:hypothetical protein VTJ04DRAFT_2639 [Mycothermus thermophilus]|uniref:uncharacterized protein n=1 Tax=Humicola insolens TaxID=85995 RepID=UPI003743188E
MPTTAKTATTASVAGAAAKPAAARTSLLPPPVTIPTSATSTTPLIPELDEEAYAREVLGLSDGRTEEDVERELRERAKVAGVEVPDLPEDEEGMQEGEGEGDGGWWLGGGTINMDERSGSRRGSASGEDERSTGAPTADTGAQTAEQAAAATTTAAGPGQDQTQPPESPGKFRRRSVSFSAYDRYIAQLDPVALGQSKFLRQEENGESENRPGVTRLTVSGQKKNGVKGFTRILTARLKRGRRKMGSGNAVGSNAPMPCVCCRDEFPTDSALLLTLPCGHRYCVDCLTIVIEQSAVDEVKFPPRCCAQPIPGTTIQRVLPRDRQANFVKTAAQFSVPWPARLFCPNPNCGEFIPPKPTTTSATSPTSLPPLNLHGNTTTTRPRPLPRNHNPFETTCPRCHTRACTLCKGPFHRPGEDCPEDRDSAAVLRLGELRGWRRCPRCRALVELRDGCSHVTCRCRAQFCYVCGAAWDAVVGCPNLCDGEAELARRRAEAAARDAEEERGLRERERERERERMEREAARRRTGRCKRFREFRGKVEEERRRLEEAERRGKEGMRERHAAVREEVSQRFGELLERVRERHAKTEQHLEDRQVLAEMEMRKGMEEKEKRVKVRLKYMEEYCRGGVTTTTTTTELPRRIVTPDDLFRLDQQRREHANLAARHRSQIEGLRSRQARNMEALLERHAKEVAELVAQQATALEDVAERCADEEEVFARTWAARRRRMARRWRVEGEMVRVEMERRTGLAFARMEEVEWEELEGEEDDEVDEVEAELGDGQEVKEGTDEDGKVPGTELEGVRQESDCGLEGDDVVRAAGGEAITA